MRVCPMCDEQMVDAHCPQDMVPTLTVGESIPITMGANVGGRYIVKEELGSGGFGTVYLAEQIGMNRSVVLKMLRQEHGEDATSVKRFYQEAQLASQLNHPNVVSVFDFGIDPSSHSPFLVMEYIRGLSFQELLHEQGELDEKRASRLLAQVAAGLCDAHALNIVHRDLKPANLMVTRLGDGREHVRVLDFGIARIADTDPKNALTRPGRVIGTPAYMSPEQFTGLADPRSDLYSLGCLMHGLVMGRPPFSGEPKQVAHSQLSSRPPALPDSLPCGDRTTQDFQDLYHALLAKNPAFRPQRASKVMAAFEAIASGQPMPSLGFERRPPRTSTKHLITPKATPRAIHSVVTETGLLNEPPEGSTDTANLIDEEPPKATQPPQPATATLEQSASRSFQEARPRVKVPLAKPSRKRLLVFASVPAGAIALGLLYLKPRPEAAELLSAPVPKGGVVTPTPARTPPLFRPKKEPPPSMKSAPVRWTRIVTEPSGCEVYNAKTGALLGTAPMEIPIPPKGSTEVRLVGEGYQTRHVSIDGSVPVVNATLVPQTVWRSPKAKTFERKKKPRAAQRRPRATSGRERGTRVRKARKEKGALTPTELPVEW